MVESWCVKIRVKVSESRFQSLRERMKIRVQRACKCVCVCRMRAYISAQTHAFNVLRPLAHYGSTVLLLLLLHFTLLPSKDGAIILKHVFLTLLLLFLTHYARISCHKFAKVMALAYLLLEVTVCWLLSFFYGLPNTALSSARGSRHSARSWGRV